MLINWLQGSELVAAARRAMLPCELAVDIGCGIVPQKFVHVDVHICCEPYSEYVEHLQSKIAAQELHDRNYVVLNMGWGEAVRYFPEKSVDTFFLIDVIEHLEKDEGRALLALTEKIARKQVVIFTPLGFMPQHHADGKDGWGLSGGEWQEHKSGWTPDDFVGDEWEFFAAREFHTIDSSGAPIEKPFGAFWAIRTCALSRVYDRTESKVALHQRELHVEQMCAEVRRKDAEINGLLSVRVERRIRRLINGMRAK